MKLHKRYGISAPEKGWVPSPGYLLRRHRIIKLLSRLPRGRLLEVGCGAGALVYDCSLLGFQVEALETSPAALEVARFINRNNTAVVFHAAPLPAWSSTFDCLLALEVLEHIADDRDALRRWYCWLKPGGHMLLSVPAHRRLWSASDIWAGHIRRYDRIGLQGVLQASGFSSVHLETYGFPLANIIRPVRARYHAAQLKKQPQHVQQQLRSQCSGIERSLEARLYPVQASLLGTQIMHLFCLLQELFCRTEWGNGYIALCKKN